MTEIDEETTAIKSTAEKKPLIQMIDAYEKKIQESKPEKGHKGLVEEVTGITEEGNLIVDHDNKTAKLKNGANVKKTMKRVTIREFPVTEAGDGKTKDGDDKDGNAKNGDNGDAKSQDEKKQQKSSSGSSEKSEDRRPSGEKRLKFNRLVILRFRSLTAKGYTNNYI